MANDMCEYCKGSETKLAKDLTNFVSGFGRPGECTRDLQKQLVQVERLFLIISESRQIIKVLLNIRGPFNPTGCKDSSSRKKEESHSDSRRPRSRAAAATAWPPSEESDWEKE